jgi:hypothetical protein
MSLLAFFLFSLASAQNTDLPCRCTGRLLELNVTLSKSFEPQNLALQWSRPGCTDYGKGQEGQQCSPAGGPSYYVERTSANLTIGKASNFDWIPTVKWNEEKFEYVQSGKSATSDNDELKWMLERVDVDKNTKKLDGVTLQIWDFSEKYVHG